MRVVNARGGKEVVDGEFKRKQTKETVVYNKKGRARDSEKVMHEKKSTFFLSKRRGCKKKEQ